MLGFARKTESPVVPDYGPSLAKIVAEQRQLRDDVARLTDHVTRTEALLLKIDRWASEHIERWPGEGP
jgi:hypothetical protein